MLHSPKKRSCPSDSNSRRANIPFQLFGDMKGNRPSITRTSAMAEPSSSQSTSTRYFFAGACDAPEAPPRKALKKSDEAGSITITSPRLPKLVRYACKLR